MKKPYSVDVKHIDLIFDSLKHEERDLEIDLDLEFEKFNGLDSECMTPIPELAMTKESSSHIKDGSSPVKEEIEDERLRHGLKPQKAKTFVLK